jgi:O-antigen/teichoic acid export membrane protein
MLANNIIRQFLTQFIGLVSGFVISIITARILGPENRGEFSMLLNTSGFLCLLFGFSYGTSMVYIIANNKMPLRNTINSFGLLVLILIAICFATLFFFPTSWYQVVVPKSGNTSYYLWVLFALFALTVTGILYNSVLSGKKLFKEQQLSFLITSTISIIAYIIVFIYRQELDINVRKFSLFYLLLAILPNLGYYLIYLKKTRPAMSFHFLDTGQMKYVLGFSLMAYLCTIFHFLSCRIDFWIVEYYKGSKDLGIYSLAVNLAQMIWILPQAISVILLSYSGDEDKQKSNDNTNTLSRVALAIIFLAAPFLFFTIDFFMPLLFGIEYTDSAFLFKMLLFGIVPFSLTTILSSYFAGSGQVKVNLYCSFLGFISCLILDLLLIPKFGTPGAAIASGISYIISTTFIVLMYLKTTHTHLSALILFKKQDLNLIRHKLKQLTGKH